MGLRVRVRQASWRLTRWRVGRGECEVERAVWLERAPGPVLTSLIRDLDDDILIVLSVRDDDLDNGHRAAHAMVLTRRAQGVLEQLEHAVVQMRGDVREREVGPALEHNLWCVAVRTLAQVLRILDRLLKDLCGQRVPVNEADVAGQVILPVQLDVPGGE